MKKRAVGILVGVMVSSMLLSACGSNEAKEAASESAQVEEEGTGERTEEGEKVETTEAEQKDIAQNSDEKDSDSKDSAEDQSEAPQAEDNSEDAQAAAPAGKIGILLPEKNDNAAVDETEMSKAIAEGGYEAEVKNAEGDSTQQISQIQEFIDQEVSALIIDPVDPYALTDILETAKEKSIPVISYDTLIRNTAAVNYYACDDTRAIGKEVAGQIIKNMDLDKAREEKQSYTIEFLMGSTDDNGALFFCNGVLEKLQEYLDDGTLVCKSGNMTFDSTGILRWDQDAAQAKMKSILDEFYQEEKTPNIIITASDEFAIGVQELLEERGILSDSEEWPVITGYGSEMQAVKDVAEGKITLTTYLDRKELAQGGAKMALDYLAGEKVDVKDYSQYDNGTKIVGTFTCGAQLIDKDNYQILVDNGTYDEEEIKPDPTPTATPEPIATPEPTLTPEVTSNPEATITPKATVTPTASGTPAATDKTI